jgi:hypothetical protein
MCVHNFSLVQILITFKYGLKVSKVCYLTMLSGSRLYGIDNTTINEYEAE